MKAFWATRTAGMLISVPRGVCTSGGAPVDLTTPSDARATTVAAVPAGPANCSTVYAPGRASVRASNSTNTTPVMPFGTSSPTGWLATVRPLASTTRTWSTRAGLPTASRLTRTAHGRPCATSSVEVVSIPSTSARRASRNTGQSLGDSLKRQPSWLSASPGSVSASRNDRKIGSPDRAVNPRSRHGTAASTL